MNDTEHKKWFFLLPYQHLYIHPPLNKHKKAWDKSQAYSLYYPKVCTLTPSGVPIKTVSVIFVNNPCSTTPVRAFNSAPNVTGSLIGNTSKSII